MGDQAQFSDDISALWGPDDTGVLEPAQLQPHHTGATSPRANGTGEPRGEAEERLAAVERDIRLLLERVTAGFGMPTALDGGQLDAIRTEVEAELAGTRREVLAELDRRMADSAARVQERVGERLGAVETELRHGIATVAAAMEAQEYESVGKHRARALRHELERQFAAQVTALRAETDDVLAQRIAEVEARLAERLDRAAGDLAAVVDRVAGVERDMTAVLDSQAALKEAVDATSSRLDAQEARLEQRLADLAARHADTDPPPTVNGAPATARGRMAADSLRALRALPRSIRGS